MNPATPTTPLKNAAQVTSTISLGDTATLPEVTVFGTIPKPGQSYESADEAAMGAVFFINRTSVREQREYAGWIYRNLQDSKFYFSNPVRGEANDSSPGPQPNGMTPIGTYHTHGGRAKGQSVATDETFSPQDTLKATLAKQVAYLGTPKGRVLKYIPIGLLPIPAQAQYPTGFVESLFEPG